MLYDYSRHTRKLIVSVARKFNSDISLWEKKQKKKKKQTRSVSCKTQPCTLAANDIDIVLFVSADSREGFQSKSASKSQTEIITWSNC